MVAAATAVTSSACPEPLPGRTMLGFSTIASRSTPCSARAAKTARRTSVVTASQVSIVWSPSMRTSGSTTGTSPPSWHRAA